MPRPSDSPFDWASDALYPAGADPWSAQPTKVAPSPGLVDTGFVPGTLARAEEMNALLRRLTEWAQHFESITDEQIVVVPGHAIVPGTNSSVIAISAPAWDTDLVTTAAWEITPGSSAAAVVDVTSLLRGSCQWRIWRVRGGIGGSAQFTATPRRRVANTGAWQAVSAATDTSLGGDPVRALFATQTPWVSHVPGDRAEVRLFGDPAAPATLVVTSLEIEVRYT